LFEIAHETKLVFFMHSNLNITTPKGGGFKNYNKDCRNLKNNCFKMRHAPYSNRWQQGCALNEQTAKQEVQCCK
ncbi:MAG: hypothetical protein L3J31_01375, partial [Bacteroidales bacterium]|nr:hypothetical protein [Bacteroidales bacterium]